MIYQPDVRMRNERCHRIRERPEEEYDQLVKDGRGHRSKFNPKRPWDAVWGEMAERKSDWWYNNVDLPWLMVEAKLKSPTAYVEGDAPTAPLRGAPDPAAGAIVPFEPPVNHGRRRGQKRAMLALAPAPHEHPQGGADQDWHAIEWTPPAPTPRGGGQDLSEHNGSKFIKRIAAA